MILKVLLTSILITVNVINAHFNAGNERQQYSQLRFRREADNCGDGYRPGTFYGCSDIDECYENETICGNLKCINTEGSYECKETTDETTTVKIEVITDEEETNEKSTGDCNKGFRRNWFGSCTDIDECSENATLCGSAKCINTEGSYECESEVPSETTTEDDITTTLNIDILTEKPDTREKKVGYCDEGYERDWFGSCNDIDECSKKTHNCFENEKCENKVGSFACICLDENLKDTSGRCKSTAKSISCESDPCSHGCVQNGNTFECLCPAGYKLENNQRNCVDINECELEISACEHDCKNTLGSFSCDCREGFKLVNGSQCVQDCGGNGCTTTDYSESDKEKEKQRYGEIEEEKEVNHVLIGTRTDLRNLKCPIGYYFNKETEVCEDIDECITSLHNCEFDSECRNTLGSFVCEECEQGAVRLPNGTCEIPRCYPGYEFSDAKQKCVDFDECKNIAPCGEMPCWNVDGAYFCACTNGNCDANGYKKGCIPGFKPSTRLISKCEDENECLSSTQGLCSNDQECVNTFGGFYCRCKLGLRRDRHGRCVDIDECTLFPSLCTTNCVNTFGSYYCSPFDNRQREENEENDKEKCNGVIDKRTGKCIVLEDKEKEHEDTEKLTTVCDSKECEIEDGCHKGFKRDSQGICRDVDECRKEDICGDLRCENTNGGYKCIDEQESMKTCDGNECYVGNKKCLPGFKMNRNGVCEDIDECIEDICDDDKVCKNTPGSYECNEDHENLIENCSPGYFFDKQSNSCEDIDECQLEIDNCMEFGCQNTIGSYKCIEQKCFPGFELKNGVCEDINECHRLGSSACMQNETCINSKGLYFCQKCKNEETVYRCYSRKQCLPGFEPFMYKCVDVDECKVGFHDCVDEEQCVNTIPGYRCECKHGYTRNRSNKCEKSHNSCGMDNICPDLTQEFPCPIGYQLSDDKLKCEDIDECLYERCSEGETCVNLRGGHRCYIN